MGYQIWYCVCLLFGAYNLWILFEESRLVSFNKINVNLTSEKFSVCLSLGELIENGVFAENDVLTPGQMIDRVADLLLTGNEPNLVRQTSCLRHNHVCLEFVPDRFHRIFPNISGYEFKIFINPSNETEIYFFENVYTHNRLDNGQFVFNVQIVQIRFLPHPFETDCTLNREDSLNHDDQRKAAIYKKVDCLLRCYKSTADSTFLFYGYEENARLKLKRNEALAADPKCQELCSPKDCFAKFYYKFLSFRDGQQLPRIEVEYYSLVAVAFLGSYEFAIQFISLAFLFLDLSFCEILVICSRGLKSRIPRHLWTVGRRLSPRLSFRLPLSGRHAALALCVLLLAVLAFFSIRDYFNYDFFVKDYFESTKQFMPFTIFICLPVQLIYLNEGEPLRLANELLFRNKTFQQIENDTERFFRQLIRSSHLQKGGIRLAWQVELEPETIFKDQTFHVDNGEDYLLARCFRIDVNLNELKYDTNMALSQLVIELNYATFRVFYVDYRNQLTWRDKPTPRKTRLYIIKKFRLAHPFKSNCLNYNLTHPCTERDNCWDYCYGERFFASHASISSRSVVYKKNFDESALSVARFSSDEDEAIRDDCMAFYKNRDCQKIVFEEEFEQIEFASSKSATNQVVVDLYLFKEASSEVEQFALTSLIFALINFETILIGLNADKLLSIVIRLARRTLGIRAHPKFSSFLLVFLCLAGFFGHCNFIFTEILTSPLTKSEGYERLTKISLPDFIICLETDLSQLDEYEKFTGHYLDQITSNLTFQKVFDRFTILDKNLNPVTVQAERLSESARKIKINRTYVYNLKCFNFETEISFNQHDLFMIDTIILAKIHFKPTVYAPDCDCLKIYIAFFDRMKGSFEKLQGYYLRRDPTSSLKSTLLVQPVVMEIEYSDRFYYFKNPLALFKVESYLNDDLLYYRNLVRKFRAITNCSTQLRPLKGTTAYKLEINDALLKQYYLQIQSEIDNSPFINPDHRVEMFNLNTLSTYQTIEQPEITIVPSAFKYKLTITNQSNYAKLLINLLNGLGLWFSASCYDLNAYLLKLLALIQRFNGLLLRLEKRLRPKKFIVF